MRRFLFWCLLAGLGFILGGGSYHFLRQDATGWVTQIRDAIPWRAEHAAKAAPTPAEKVVTVEAARVSVDTVLDTIHAVASLMPNEAVIVSPEIAGRIDRLPFTEGQRVKAGDLVVELDSDVLQAELSKARSDLTLAEANRARAITLAKQGTGTVRARDEAVAAYQSAVADVALAQARLQKAHITAPFSGVLGLRAVSVGAFVSPGDHVVEIADIDPIKVDFRVPELALSSLRVGQHVIVTVDALPGQTFDGEVYVIDPIVDANGRAVRLRARIPNPDGKLSPGQFARVQIVVDRRENALLIPESAVFSEGQKRYVFRVVDGRVKLTEITLGQRRPGQVEVRDGLDSDTVVVTAGHQQVRDGSRVTVVKPGAGA
jgi:membrane fusion protein (multidrug efflux system)